MTLITPEELADLEAKALAATQGPFEAEGTLVVRVYGDVVEVDGDEAFATVADCSDGVSFSDHMCALNAAYFAACDPPTALRLIATIRAVTARAEAAEKERDELREALRPFADEAVAGRFPSKRPHHGSLLRRGFWPRRPSPPRRARPWVSTCADPRSSP